MNTRSNVRAVVAPELRAAAAMAVPDAETLLLLPGVAEKVIRAEREPAVLGEKMILTVHDAFEGRVVTPETQSPTDPV